MRNIDVRDKYQSFVSRMHHDWTKPATQVCDLTGNPTSKLLLCGMTPDRMSHPGQGTKFFISTASALIYLQSECQISRIMQSLFGTS